MHSLFLFTAKITLYQFYLGHLSFLFVSKPGLKLPSTIYNKIYFRGIKSALMIVTQNAIETTYTDVIDNFVWIWVYTPLYFISLEE